MKRCLLLLLILNSFGCNRPAPETPTVNLPHSLRCENWGGGSCVHASWVSLLHWQGRHNLAAYWRARYGGGEYAERFNSKLDAEPVRYAVTTAGDVAFLDWALQTRRGAAVVVRHASASESRALFVVANPVEYQQTLKGRSYADA